MNLNDITIEKGVALPETNFGGTKWQYEDTFRAMDVGDSFAIDLPEEKVKQSQAALRSILSRYSKKLDHKYATRKVDNGATMRVWRTA